MDDIDILIDQAQARMEGRCEICMDADASTLYGETSMYYVMLPGIWSIDWHIGACGECLYELSKDGVDRNLMEILEEKGAVTIHKDGGEKARGIDRR